MFDWWINLINIRILLQTEYFANSKKDYFVKYQGLIGKILKHGLWEKILNLTSWTSWGMILKENIRPWIYTPICWGGSSEEGNWKHAGGEGSAA